MQPKSGIRTVKRRRFVRDLGNDSVDMSKLDRVQLVKIVYKRERERWEGLQIGEPAHYTLPRVYDGAPAVTIEGDLVVEKAKASEWIKLSNWIEDHDLPTKAFLAAVFDAVPYGEGRAPEPKQVRTLNNLRMWAGLKSDIEARISISFNLQRTTAAAEFACQRGSSTAEDAWLLVLLNSGLQLSPLFRYCIAVSLSGGNFIKVADYYKAEAILQFERYRQFYKRHWKAILPEGFSAMSQEAFPFLVVN